MFGIAIYYVQAVSISWIAVIDFFWDTPGTQSIKFPPIQDDIHTLLVSSLVVIS